MASSSGCAAAQPTHTTVASNPIGFARRVARRYTSPVSQGSHGAQGFLVVVRHLREVSSAKVGRDWPWRLLERCLMSPCSSWGWCRHARFGRERQSVAMIAVHRMVCGMLCSTLTVCCAVHRRWDDYGRAEQGNIDEQPKSSAPSRSASSSGSSAQHVQDRPGAVDLRPRTTRSCRWSFERPQRS